MTIVSVSGPTDLTLAKYEYLADCLDKELDPEDTLLSGAAYGVDTAAALWANDTKHPLMLAAPIERIHNRNLKAIADFYIPVAGSYMDRNDMLALSGDRLVAFPKRAVEELRSGTWATIRRFKKAGKMVVCYPLDESELFVP